MSRWVTLRWRSLPSANRRRIVLGSLVLVSLAARDGLLFVASAGLFALGEVAPNASPLRGRGDAIS